MANSAQLIESEQRFRSLFENNPDLILFQDHSGTILDANQAFLSLVNKSRQEVLQQSIANFVPPEQAKLLHQKLEEAFEGHKVRFDADVKFDGVAPKRFDITKVPLWAEGKIAGVHALFRDITEVTNAHRTIQEQAHRLNTIFESITDAFLLLDKQWCFAYVNHEVERLLSLSREQLLGRSVWEVFPEEVGSELYRQCKQAMRNRQAVHFEAFLARMQLWLWIKAFPSEAGLSVYFTDITDRVKAHEELYRQNKDLQQFTYIVSHNLRAPLSNVLGLVDVLTTLEPASGVFQQALERLQASAEQLDTVLADMNNILAVRDTRDVAPELVSLADVIEQARGSLDAPLRQCGGTLHVSVPAELRVRGVRAYFYSIFINLLSNAIKYRSEARPLRIDIEGTETPGQGVQVVIADNGSGFDLAKAGSDVFKLYKRFHTRQLGRGMGLYLVKTHVEAMGGHIEVSSQVDVGTRFTIHLR
jgi:PAS domain S-box-containing protein